MKSFFKIEENNTTFSREIVAGLTTFFTMAYILFVNPQILGSQFTNDGILIWEGIPGGAVFLATIFAAMAGTLVMGLFANVPYAQAPGMGLNAFFTWTVGVGMGFTWQQALGMVFLCGMINVIITVTKIRKHIIKAIPKSMQLAIGGGIGLFIAYIGILNVGLVDISGPVPALAAINSPGLYIALFGIVLTVVLFMVKSKISKYSIIIGIVATTIVATIYSVISQKTLDGGAFAFEFSFDAIGASFSELGGVFGQAFVGIGELFTKQADKLPLTLAAIFAFSITDTFDTIGTFIGTGRRSGIFSDEDLSALENSKGFKSKMDKALFADSVATSIGAVFGTSNTTTYVESAAGIEAGGRTGFTSVVVAACFGLSILLAPIIGLVTSQATAAALIIVGVMMLSSFKEIEWDELSEAIPAFFAAVFMALSYSISNGIGLGFIFYILVKVCKGKAKEIHPVLWVSAALFVVYFVAMALI